MKKVAHIVVLLVVSAALALSQSDTAVVFGVVKDPSGAAIAGANILLRNEATGISRELQSNDSGLFYFTVLPSGSYEFTVEAAGFKQYRDSHVRIQVAQVGRIDVPMQLGNTSEILEVEGNISTLSLIHI